MGTVSEKDNFEVEVAARYLHDAFKGLGTNEKVIIEVLGEISNEQRQAVNDKYTTLYGRDMREDLKSELGGHFLDLCTALMTPSHYYEADCLHKAIKGLGTDEEVLIDIICSKSNSEIELIKEAYELRYESNLSKDIAADTSGAFRRLLVSLLSAGRDEKEDINSKQSTFDATKLQETGTSQWAKEDSVFNRIVRLRSKPQLMATFEVYKLQSGLDIQETVRKHFSGDIRKGLLAIIQIMENAPKYYAEKLHASLKGPGTDDETVIRIVVSRSEMDLEAIKEEYQKKYKRTLSKAVKADCSGDYGRMLVKIIDG